MPFGKHRRVEKTETRPKPRQLLRTAPARCILAPQGHIDVLAGNRRKAKRQTQWRIIRTRCRAAGLEFCGVRPLSQQEAEVQYDVSRSLDCVRELLAHGATWNPEEKYDLNSLRRSLLECEPDVTIELLLLFRKHNACPAERVHKLLGTPRMKGHLKPETSALLRLGIHLEAGPNLHKQNKKDRLTSRRTVA